MTALTISGMKILFAFTFLLLTFSGHAQKSESVQKAMALLKKYSPEGYYVITQASNVPGKYKFGRWTYRLGPQMGVGMYIKGKSGEKIVKSLSTAVHEMTHSYTHRLVYQTLQEQDQEPQTKQEYIVIQIKVEENILIKVTETFIGCA